MNNFNTKTSLVDLKIPTKKLRFDHHSCELIDQPKSEAFLKGPIMISWIHKVSCLPGKALPVALAILWISDMNKKQPIKLTKKAMELFNFSSDAASDAIKRLEMEGLIKVIRQSGQRPWIELLPIINDR